MASVVQMRAQAEEPGKAELKAQFVEMRAKGYSYSKIASKLQVSKSTLSNWRSELEEEIASLKAMELDSLYEQYFLTKMERIKLLGEQVKGIRKELLKRDLSKVETKDLMELLLKYDKQLQEEYVEVNPLSDKEIRQLKALR